MLDPSKAQARVIVHCALTDIVHVERSRTNGKMWLTVKGESAGLPVEADPRRPLDRSSWHALWDEDVIEVERFTDGRWIPFDDNGKDWEVM